MDKMKLFIKHLNLYRKVYSINQFIITWINGIILFLFEFEGYDVEYFPEGYQQPTLHSNFYDEGKITVIFIRMAFSKIWFSLIDQDEMPINAQNPQFKPKHFDSSSDPIFSSMNYLNDHRDMSDDENDEHMNYIDPAFSQTATWTRPNFYPSGTEVLRYLKKKKL